MLDSLSVLLIDDDDLSRDVIALHLSAAGHVPLPAESGLAALALLETLSAPPDLLLSDLHMPGPTGPALLGLLLPHLRPETPAIAMSATQPTPEHVAGYHAFLLKPFTAQQLEDAMVLARHAAAEPSAASESTMMTPLPTPQPSNPLPSLLAVAHAGEPTPESYPVLDDAIFGQLLEMLKPAQLSELFALSFGELQKHLARMETALETDDQDALRHSAHTVKGSFAIVGARELQHLGALLEAGTGSHTDNQATLQQIVVASGRLRDMLGTRGVFFQS